MNLRVKMSVHFLIAKQKSLSKNQLTVRLYKLCTHLSTKIVDNLSARDDRLQRLSRASFFLSMSLPRLSMRFKVARVFKCLGVELAAHHRSGRMADLAVDSLLDHHPRHHRRTFLQPAQGFYCAARPAAESRAGISPERRYARHAGPPRAIRNARPDLCRGAEGSREFT